MKWNIIDDQPTSPPTCFWHFANEICVKSITTPHHFNLIYNSDTLQGFYIFNYLSCHKCVSFLFTIFTLYEMSQVWQRFIWLVLYKIKMYVFEVSIFFVTNMCKICQHISNIFELFFKHSERLRDSQSQVSFACVLWTVGSTRFRGHEKYTV